MPGGQGETYRLVLTEEDYPAVSASSRAVIAEAKAAGVYVFGGGIDESVAPILVAADGTVSGRLYPGSRVTGGFLVLEVPTRDEVSELTASVERLTQHIERLKAERAATPPASALSMEAVGGGWYELKVGTVVVEKVQGREEAEATLAKLQAQQN